MLVSCFLNSDPGSIKKLGEGTYGEAFRVGPTVCKIVPIDGEILVNNEVQKVCLYAGVMITFRKILNFLPFIKLYPAIHASTRTHTRHTPGLGSSVV